MDGNNLTQEEMQAKINTLEETNRLILEELRKLSQQNAGNQSVSVETVPEQPETTKNVHQVTEDNGPQENSTPDSPSPFQDTEDDVISEDIVLEDEDIVEEETLENKVSIPNTFEEPANERTKESHAYKTKQEYSPIPEDISFQNGTSNIQTNSFIQNAMDSIDKADVNPQAQNRPVYTQTMQRQQERPVQPKPRIQTEEISKWTKQQQNEKTRIEKRDRSVESFIGKNIMAIGASILIFIALIMFATLIIPYLNDAIKMILMFAFSFALIGAGEYFITKHPDNKWFLTITGCGVGAVFASLFVTRIYFEMLNDISLYLLIIAWAAGVAYLSKKDSIIFTIIGQIGLIISTGFGATTFSTHPDNFTIIGFVIILAELPFVCNILISKNKLLASIPVYAGFFINIVTIVITRSLSAFFGSGDDFSMLFPARISEWMIFIAINLSVIGFNYLYYNLAKEGKTLSTFYVVQTLFTVGTILILEYFVTVPLRGGNNIKNYMPLISIPIFVVLMMAINNVDCDKDLRTVAQSIILVISLLLIANTKTSILNLYIIVIMLGCCVFSAKNKLFMLYMPIIYLGFTILKNSSGLRNSVGGTATITITTIAGLVILAAYAYIITVSEKIQIDDDWVYKTFKGLVYVSFITGPFRAAYTLTHYNWDVESTYILRIAGYLGAFAVILLVQYVVNKTKYLGNTKITAPMIVNTFFMLFGLYFFIAFDENPILFALSIIVMTGFYSLNVSNILEFEGVGGAYIGFKYTLLWFVIMANTDAEGYITSVICLVIAVISIYIGFAKMVKSLRIYGLGLAIVSIAKLILLDIEYNGTVSRAFSFLFCGILCFVISFIYNKLDSKFKMAEDIETEEYSPIDNIVGR